MALCRNSKNEALPDGAQDSPAPTNPYVQSGGGVFVTNFPLLILSPNLLKTIFPYVMRRGGVRVGDQLSTFDPKSKSAKNQISVCQEGRVVGDQLSAFGPESKSAKILYFLCLRVC